ncbi:energy transducer TonB [Bacteroides sp. 519]|uniref:energy transducer TonB n=1 Tax=Bacteroides sp. 519 TaxID=2302937 RepID=UPI0013D0416E|nr:energy transducer TonB [Bacteroides sp. 519]
MEIKKSKKAELESRKTTWYAMGFIVVLAFVFIILEWSGYDNNKTTVSLMSEPDIEMELLPIIIPDEPLPPPPPPPTDAEVLNIILRTDEHSTEGSGLLELSDEELELEELLQIRYIPLIMDEEEDTHGDPNGYPVEIAPQYPGGYKALMQFLNTNIRYPQRAKEEGIQGRVIVQFVIQKDGSVGNVKLIRGIDADLDKEALRIVNLMPKWTPGRQMGRAVKVSYILPVMFKLKGMFN